MIQYYVKCPRCNYSFSHGYQCGGCGYKFSDKEKVCCDNCKFKGQVYTDGIHCLNTDSFIDNGIENDKWNSSIDYCTRHEFSKI